MIQSPYRGARLISAAQGNSRLGSSSSKSLDLTWDSVPRAVTENEVRLIALVREYSAGHEDARVIDNIFELLFEETSPNIMDADAGRSALHWAVLHGQSQLVRALLEAGALANTFAKDGFSPLMAAVRKGSSEIVGLLLDEGAKIDLINTTNGCGPLQLACVFANTELVQLLLDRKATPDVRWNGAKGVMTPLVAAAAKVCEPKPIAELYLQVVEKLLAAGACPDVTINQEKGETLLHNAVARNQPGLVRALLTAQASPDTPTKDGVTPLMTAVRLSSPELVEALLDGGAAVEAINEFNGKTAFSVACNLGNLELVQLLLARGASVSTRWFNPNDVNAPILVVAFKCDDFLWRSFVSPSTVRSLGSLSRGHSVGSGNAAAAAAAATAAAAVPGPGSASRDCSGRLTPLTPRHMGTQVYLEIVRVLLQWGADPNTQGSKNGTTPLLIAVENNHLGLLRVLLEAGANPNLPDTNGCTPLIAACTDGHLDMARVLLEYGAKPNMQRRDGWTALLGATLNRNTAMAELLLAAGAQHSVLVPPGELLAMESTPLMAACGEGSLELVRLLLATGADPNVANSAGQTAVWCACRGGQAEAVQELLTAGAVLRPRGQAAAPSALVQAAQSGNRRCVELVLEAGAQVDEYDTNNLILPCGQLVGGRFTPLAAACSRGCGATAELLLQRGAQPDVCWIVEGRTGKVELRPLLAVVSHPWSDDSEGDRECAALVEMLLAAGAKTEAAEPGARCTHNAIEVAAREGRSGALRALLGHGGQANLVDKDGATPLILAALKGSVECVKLLLAAGANANATTQVGVSPLVAAIGAFAAGDGNLELIQALLEAGAAPNAPFFEEDTILTAAVEGGNPALVSTLLAAGADPNMPNTAGALPMQLALTKGHSELVRLLLLAGASPHLPNVDWASMRYHQKGRHEILELLAAAGVVVPPPPPSEARSRGCRSCSTSGATPTSASSSGRRIQTRPSSGEIRRRSSQGGSGSPGLLGGGCGSGHSAGFHGGAYVAAAGGNAAGGSVRRKSSQGRGSGSGGSFGGSIGPRSSVSASGSLGRPNGNGLLVLDTSASGMCQGPPASVLGISVANCRRPPPLDIGRNNSCSDSDEVLVGGGNTWATSAPASSSGAAMSPSMCPESSSSAPPTLLRNPDGSPAFERSCLLLSPTPTGGTGGRGTGGGSGSESSRERLYGGPAYGGTATYSASPSLKSNGSGRIDSKPCTPSPAGSGTTPAWGILNA
ncbi:hypothetical protein Vretimale_854 [Volvox reticuliferus]|uniref:Uncharacterized protein n=1 Tax=Volvox reticuliferus TaxID=1737510 RepID=A0A8J4D3I5_9CHLO|nr:hypothetical protein Vretifemale_2225 [Volvox reticuliferus]GIL94626.1 hypothetical protein Vretimale_854 [Volvox reticuliferus]